MFICQHSAAALASSLHYPPACHHRDAAIFHPARLLPAIIMTPLPVGSPDCSTLTANIRKRRGRKVPIQMPLFMDAKTQPSAAIAAVDAAPDSSGAEGPAAAAALASGPGGGLGAERAAALAAAADDASSRHLPEAAVFAGGAEAHARATGDWDADASVGPAHAPEPQHIHMDAMVFGMGCCCLQVTFQARDLAESRYLYDQLHVLSPLMMALTANAPIWRGHLADTDTRWDVIAASVDCRTPQERGCCCPSAAAAAAAAAPDSAAPGAGCGAAAATAATTAGDGSAGAGAQATPAAGSANHYDSCLPSWMALPAAAGSAGCGVRPISKSRYSSIDCFISASPLAKEGYNDVPLANDEEASAMLREAGVDERLSRHIAHLFVRDPLVIFKERIALDDALSSEHFENIQSTNWRSVRWKPPPPDAPDMGWRVELRTMEAQVTDFENAAFTVFVVLLSRVILSFDLNLYIPLSKVRGVACPAAALRRTASVPQHRPRGELWWRELCRRRDQCCERRARWCCVRVLERPSPTGQSRDSAAGLPACLGPRAPQTHPFHCQPLLLRGLLAPRLTSPSTSAPLCPSLTPCRSTRTLSGRARARPPPGRPSSSASM
jgi:hypothetical protein